MNFSTDKIYFGEHQRTAMDAARRLGACGDLPRERYMPGLSPNNIAEALADALPRDATRRDELVAVGILATALIAGVAAAEERAELVDVFCNILRTGVARELN